MTGRHRGPVPHLVPPVRRFAGRCSQTQAALHREAPLGTWLITTVARDLSGFRAVGGGTPVARHSLLELGFLVRARGVPAPRGRVTTSERTERRPTAGTQGHGRCELLGSPSALSLLVSTVLALGLCCGWGGGLLLTRTTLCRPTAPSPGTSAPPFHLCACGPPGRSPPARCYWSSQACTCVGGPGRHSAPPQQADSRGGVHVSAPCTAWRPCPGTCPGWLPGLECTGDLCGFLSGTGCTLPG